MAAILSRPQCVNASIQNKPYCFPSPQLIQPSCLIWRCWFVVLFCFMTNPLVDMYGTKERIIRIYRLDWCKCTIKIKRKPISKDCVEEKIHMYFFYRISSPIYSDYVVYIYKKSVLCVTLVICSSKRSHVVDHLHVNFTMYMMYISRGSKCAPLKCTWLTLLRKRVPIK